MGKLEKLSEENKQIIKNSGLPFGSDIYIELELTKDHPVQVRKGSKLLTFSIDNDGIVNVETLVLEGFVQSRPALNNEDLEFLKKAKEKAIDNKNYPALYGPHKIEAETGGKPENYSTRNYTGSQIERAIKAYNDTELNNHDFYEQLKTGTIYKKA